MSLERTQQAFNELAANSMLGPGAHTHENMRSGVDGLSLGEVDFDASRHLPTAITPLSLLEQATGRPQVRQVLPDKPLGVQLVVDYSPVNERPSVTQLKHTVFSNLHDSVDKSLPDITDRLFAYSLGKPATVENNLPSLGSEIDEVSAQQIAELCRLGLTIVISDFNRLARPLSEAEPGYGIAIKVNHPAELELPAGRGVMALANGVEVNTNKPRSLNKANALLNDYNRAITGHLRRAGMLVVQAVVNTNVEKSLSELDLPLSEALTAYDKTS